MTGLSIAKSLELHLVHPGLTRDDIRHACEAAHAAHLAHVTVLPVHVDTAVRELAGSDTRVCAAIGYPWGHETLVTRLGAIDQSRDAGAHGVAIALDHSALLEGDSVRAHTELAVILERAAWASLVTTRGQGTLTIVAETQLVDPQVMRPLFAQLHESPVAFVQTASGVGAEAVTEDHVRMMRSLVPSDVGVVAVGLVGTLEDARGLLNAGAVRIGSRSALAIAARERSMREERASS